MLVARVELAREGGCAQRGMGSGMGGVSGIRK